MNFTNSARGYLDSDLEVFISHFKSCSHDIAKTIALKKKQFSSFKEGESVKS
jgi:hypothetical protein